MFVLKEKSTHMWKRGKPPGNAATSRNRNALRTAPCNSLLVLKVRGEADWGGPLAHLDALRKQIAAGGISAVNSRDQNITAWREGVSFNGLLTQTILVGKYFFSS